MQAHRRDTQQNCHQLSWHVLGVVLEIALKLEKRVLAMFAEPIVRAARSQSISGRYV
jgi:hypothetical protein